MNTLIFTSVLAFFMSFQSLAQVNELKPFSTDGCSVVPDFEYTKCCVEHDYYYWKGGTEKERLAADKKLKSCINQKHSSDLIGFLFYYGVRLGGHPYFTNSFRWGYGWTKLRGYRKLNNEELEAVRALEPADIFQTPITKAKLAIEKHPSRFGNYCLDEIQQYVEHHYTTTAKINKIRVIELANYVSVRVHLDNYKNILFRYRLKNWNKCYIPVYSEKLPNYFYNVIQY